jgi:hypothetical protein
LPYRLSWSRTTPAVRAANLVIWWDKAFCPEADQAVAGLVGAFEPGHGSMFRFTLPVRPAPGRAGE